MWFFLTLGLFILFEIYPQKDLVKLSLAAAAAAAAINCFKVSRENGKVGYFQGLLSLLAILLGLAIS